MQKNRLIHYLHLHFLVFIAGFTAILGELITNSSESIVWHRMAIASILAFFVLILRKNSLIISFSKLKKYSFQGLIIALHWITFFEAIKQSNISITLAMFSTAAFFTSILEPIFYKRNIKFSEIFLGFSVIVGIFLIFHSEIKYLSGIFLGIISALLASFFSVFNGILVKDDNAVRISFYEFFTGVIFITLFLFLRNDIESLLIQNIFTLNYLYIFILGSICTAYAFIASVYLLKYISPFSMVLTYNLEPIYGIILAVCIFGSNEIMTFEFYIGFFLILSSILINMYFKRNNYK
jgi:drug/metabolite transporter (DMT)-like permease